MRYCRKLFAVLILLFSIIFLNAYQNTVYANDESTNTKPLEDGSSDEDHSEEIPEDSIKVTLPLEEGAEAEVEIPVQGEVRFEEDPEQPLPPKIPDEPVLEIPAEPDRVETIINKGFSNISEIDTGDRQRWDYYKQIFLMSGVFLVVLALFQLFKKQEADA